MLISDDISPNPGPEYTCIVYKKALHPNIARILVNSTVS